MTTAPELFILRHGETEWNLEGRLQGAFDAPLTATGREQAMRQAQILMTLKLDAFTRISSPQGRALETARLAFGGHEGLTVDPDLREIGIGDWAGVRRDSLPPQAQGFDLYERAPGGEGFAALAQRCGNFLQRLDGPAVLVTHGITSRMIRTLVCGQPIEYLREIGGGQGCVYHLKNGVQKRLD